MRPSTSKGILRGYPKTLDPIEEDQRALEETLSREADYQEILPLPVLQYQWSQSEELNSQLREFALAMEKNEPGVTITNVGGWHSEKNIQHSDEACIQSLLYRIHLLTRELVRRTVPEPEDRHYEGWYLQAWLNINRKGQYNEVHTHVDPYLWSGFYCVDPGNSDPLTGYTKFQDRTRVPVEVMRNSDLFQREVAISPNAGRMVIFPSALYHYVEPYMGSSPRITVAFDLAHPGFGIPVYGSDSRNWLWTHFPWVMLTAKKIKRRLGIKRSLK